MVLFVNTVVIVVFKLLTIPFQTRRYSLITSLLGLRERFNFLCFAERY